ncbi:hypothetical protein OS493_019885 [Desmophyllum pertusum]|uniref:Cadherin domain-containing protein n=1 Tax=Desmophyllum pertusum TaxID=174260 RepID=A0A9X0CM50_9CNID|nr:hypothetical protein OS493_019885 [Desmophyllum pertusum]
MFNQSLYNFTFNEEIPDGFVIGTVTATDADLGSYGVIKYELYGAGASSFTVESTNGTIKTTRVLDYEKSTDFSFSCSQTMAGNFMRKTKIRHYYPSFTKGHQ